MKEVDYDRMSDEEIMARVKARKDEGDMLCERAVAARAYINGVQMSNETAKAMEFEAFMSIFFPDKYKDKKYMEELRAARKEK